MKRERWLTLALGTDQLTFCTSPLVSLSELRISTPAMLFSFLGRNAQPSCSVPCSKLGSLMICLPWDAWGWTSKARQVRSPRE